MGGKMSRTKGQVFERLARKFFDKRIIDYEHGGTDEVDIVITVNGTVIAVECKNQATLSLPAWWRQVTEAAQATGAPVAVIFHKRNGKIDAEDQWVTMSAKHFAKLLDLLEPF